MEYRVRKYEALLANKRAAYGDVSTTILYSSSAEIDVKVSRVDR
jgi:hypothetical protein